MWNVTVKGLLAHKLRLALTALAIVLGVTFIAGTLVTSLLALIFGTVIGVGAATTFDICVSATIFVRAVKSFSKS